jgi:hypothetical protein
MGSTPTPLFVQSTALAVSVQGAMKGMATKFIGAVEDEWQLFRLALSVFAKTMHCSDTFHPLIVTVPRTTPLVPP